MSCYTSQTILDGYFSQQNLIWATDDNNTGSLNLTVLNQVMATASGEVDAMLGAVYATPFANPVPPTVVQAATLFACEALVGRRLVQGEPNKFSERATAYRKLLSTIAQNRGGLDAATPSAISAGYVQTFPVAVNSSTA